MEAPRFHTALSLVSGSPWITICRDDLRAEQALEESSALAYLLPVIPPPLSLRPLQAPVSFVLDDLVPVEVRRPHVTEEVISDVLKTGEPRAFSTVAAQPAKKSPGLPTSLGLSRLGDQIETHRSDDAWAFVELSDSIEDRALPDPRLPCDGGGVVPAPVQPVDDAFLGQR